MSSKSNMRGKFVFVFTRSPASIRNSRFAVSFVFVFHIFFRNINEVKKLRPQIYLGRWSNRTVGTGDLIADRWKMDWDLFAPLKEQQIDQDDIAVSERSST